jgi:hypothetical protein
MAKLVVEERKNYHFATVVAALLKKAPSAVRKFDPWLFV